MDPILQGTLIALIYGVSLFGLIKLFGVKYTEITQSTDHIKKGLLFPVGIASAGLTIISALNGWLQPAFTPPDGYREPWMWLIPVACLFGILIRLKYARWQRFTPLGILYLVIGIAFVGFSEELLARGILVRLISEAGFPQYLVMLVSSMIFGLLHGMNYFNGQDRKTTISQMIVATLIGMGLYTALTVSGTLWVPIILHALFDLSILAAGRKPHEPAREASHTELLVTLLFYGGTFAVFITLAVSALVG